MSKKILALLIALLMIITLVSACNTDTDEGDSPTAAPATAAPPKEPEVEEESDDAAFKLPITEEPSEITVWTSAQLANVQTDMNEGTVWIEAEKRTH
jgi:hypothetical protein